MVAALVAGGPSPLRIPAQAYQAIILAPDSAWVTKGQQVLGTLPGASSAGTLF